MHAFVNVALRAAREAARVILQSSERLDRLRVIEDSVTRFVTSAHQEANALILQQLQRSFPRHGIESRVSGTVEGSDSDTTWLIDPIDGNRNFMRGLPHHAIVIACRVGQRINHAVVVDTQMNEEFTASRGNGAQLNGRRIRVNSNTSLEKGLVSLHEPETAEQALTDRLIKGLRERRCGIRSAGCAALDVVYAAAGRTDAGWIQGGDLLQLGASALVLQESGGLLTTESGGPEPFAGSEILFGNPKCVKELLQLRGK